MQTSSILHRANRSLVNSLRKMIKPWFQTSDGRDTRHAAICSWTSAAKRMMPSPKRRMYELSYQSAVSSRLLVPQIAPLFRRLDLLVNGSEQDTLRFSYRVAFSPQMNHGSRSIADEVEELECIMNFELCLFPFIFLIHCLLLSLFWWYMMHALIWTKFMLMASKLVRKCSLQRTPVYRLCFFKQNEHLRTAHHVMMRLRKNTEAVGHPA